MLKLEIRREPAVTSVHVRVCLWMPMRLYMRVLYTRRLESVKVVLSSHGSVEDMLESEDALSEQLEALPYLVR